jgi:DNA primase
MRADQQPKYLNSPQTDIFDKGNNLYALDQAREAVRKQGQAIVVEGYMDALIAHQAGFTNVVATLGTALTDRHVQVLRRQSAREIILCLDNDAAGLRAALRGSGVAHDSTRDEAPRIDFSLLNRSERMRGRDSGPAIFVERRTILKAFSLTGGKDPDEVIRQDPSQWTRESSAAKPIIEFVFDNLSRVYDLTVTQGRREAARAAVGLVYDVADPIDREQYLQRLAGVIGTDVDLLRELARRTMHVVPRPEARPSTTSGANGTAATRQFESPTNGTGAVPANPGSGLVTPPGPGADEKVQDLVIALLLRLGNPDAWPEPIDFQSAAHRAILEQLQDGPPWPDVLTAMHRLETTLGEAVKDVLGRVQARDEENEQHTPEELGRELAVRRLELQRSRLFRQYQALDSALREEGDGLNEAERREIHVRIGQVLAGINETFVEQQRLGVVGTASLTKRRGQEVLGG